MSGVWGIFAVDRPQPPHPDPDLLEMAVETSASPRRLGCGRDGNAAPHRGIRLACDDTNDREMDNRRILAVCKQRNE